MTADIQVEVVFASARNQHLVAVTLPPGSSVDDAIAAGRLEKHFPDIDLSKLQVGIWGRVVARNQQLRDGDRVEVYRPLKLDPRDARRQLAALGKTMSGAQKS